MEFLYINHHVNKADKKYLLRDPKIKLFQQKIRPQKKDGLGY